MLMKLVGKIGKPVCAALYGVCIWLAAKKKPLPLASLFLMHTVEYFTIGRKTAKEYGIDTVKGLLNCLSFGFTWWLPIRKGESEEK